MDDIGAEVCYSCVVDGFIVRSPWWRTLARRCVSCVVYGFVHIRSYVTERIGVQVC